MDTKLGHIYALVDPRTGAVRYIGQTTQCLCDRIADHRYNARHGSRLYVHCWIRSLESKGMGPVVVTLLSMPAVKGDLDKAESFWIDAMRLRGFNLTNLTSGGGGIFVHSSETRRLLQLKRAAQPPPFTIRHSDKTRLRMSAAHGGRPFCDENGTVYNTVSEAASALGVSRSSVCAVLKGRRRSVGGHVFGYRTQSNGS